MKILLINDNGQTVAQVNDVELYDGTLPGHTAGLLDMLEALIAAAKRRPTPVERNRAGAGFGFSGGNEIALVGAQPASAHPIRHE